MSCKHVKSRVSECIGGSVEFEYLQSLLTPAESLVGQHVRWSVLCTLVCRVVVLSCSSTATRLRSSAFPTLSSLWRDSVLLFLTSFLSIFYDILVLFALCRGRWLVLGDSVF